MSNCETPWIPNDLSEFTKIKMIEHHVGQILLTLGIDLTDDSLMDTPRRVAKMYVKELFSGLGDTNFPAITTVENKFGYKTMLIETNIEVSSVCEHHLVPIVGSCHVAYIPKDKVLGLSKFNRIVRHFSARPQVQERLTQQIKKTLVEVLGTEDVIVIIDAAHFCVRMRGVRDTHTITRTSSYSGSFDELSTRDEFTKSIPKANELRLI